jgi:hypothetical protein
VRTRSVDLGAVILGALGLLDALSPWVLPAPEGAPAFADALSVVFGVGTLVALAIWAARPSRVAMWVAVVLRGISALLGALAFTDAPPTGLAIILAVLLVVTIVGIVLVVPALRRARTTAAL